MRGSASNYDYGHVHQAHHQGHGSGRQPAPPVMLPEYSYPVEADRMLSRDALPLHHYSQWQPTVTAPTVTAPPLSAPPQPLQSEWRPAPLPASYQGSSSSSSALSTQQRELLGNQMIAASLLQSRCGLPTSLSVSSGALVSARNTAYHEQASRRPSHKTIETQCAIVINKCRHLPPEEDPNFGNVEFCYEDAVEDRKLELQRAQQQRRIEEERELRECLASSSQNSYSEEDRVKMQIRLLQLQLAPRQQTVRAKLVQSYRRELLHTNGVDFTVYRQHRKSHRPKTTAKLKRQQRDMAAKQQQRKENVRSSYNRDLLAWGRQLKENRAAAAIRQRRVYRYAASFHTHREREEKKKAAEAEKRRIQALKNNDEEAYMRLLEDTKNDRLLTLVRETDSALEMLGAKIRAHKAELETTAQFSPQHQEASSANADEDEADTNENVQYTDVHPDLLKTKQAYYQVTHTVSEAVTVQPRSLAGGDLKEYQIKGLEWLVSLYNNGLNGILADEMGLGKTIQTIALLCHLMESKSNTGPFLVVVPNSTLPNWSSEFEKWAPHIEKVVYKGGPKVRKAIQQDSLLSGAFNVLITTYEFVMSDKHALAKPRWKYIIVDEGHRIKNHKSKLSVILGSYYHAVNRVLLTGTPLHNNLPELWALLNFLLPTIFNSVNDFESWFNAPFERTGERIEMSEEEELLVINRLHQVLRPFLLRRLKSEVMLELPDKVEKVIKCELSSWQVHMYRRVLEHKGIYTNVGKPGVQQMNNDLVQLRKICNHPHLFYNIDDFDETVVTASGKVHMLDRILPKLKAAGHRVLIFTQMTQLMDILEDYFELRNFTYLRLDGSTSVDDRAERMRQFQKENSDYFLFLLSTRAGGMGVNLQSADTVIIFDSDWNPQMDKQAQDRAHRIGQSKEVRVLRLITAGTVEVAILSKSREKDSVDQKVIQAGKFNNRSTDSERRAFLESVVNAGTIELKDDDEPPSDEQLNEMLARDEHELEMYEAIGQQMQVPELMTEHQDIPQWLRAAEAAEDKAEEEAEDTHLGRGARERKRVSYSENDREFEMLLRENEDSGSDDDDRNATSLDSPSGPPSKQQRSSSYPSNAGTGKPYGRGRGRPRGRGGRGRGRPRGRPRKKKDATTKVPAEVDVVRDDDVACLSCKRVDNDSCMILCDGCDNARHTFCCEPPLDRVPEGDWYCGVCEKSPPLWRRTIVELEDSAAGGAVKKQRC